MTARVRTATVGSQPFTWPRIIRISRDRVLVGGRLRALAKWRDEMARQRKQATALQTDAGLDIVSEGEIFRDDFVFYFPRLLEGFRLPANWNLDPDNLAPLVIGPIRHGEPALVADWQAAAALTAAPVKINLPGPMVVANRCLNLFHDSKAACSLDYARAANREILALAEAGCRWVQIDEPNLARFPGEAEGFGFDHLEVMLDGVPDDLHCVVHVCMGNAYRFDRLARAYPLYYAAMADRLAGSRADVISVEATAADDDRLDLFANKTVMFGLVDVHTDMVESVDALADRIHRALRGIDPGRLIVTPACGLRHMPAEIAAAKVSALVAAAAAVNGTPSPGFPGDRGARIGIP